MESNFYPYLCYRDARAALGFLTTAFGFEAERVFDGDGGTIAHAVVRFGNGRAMISSESDSDFARSTRRKIADEIGATTGGGIYATVEDVDAHHDRAKAAGARIVMELVDQDYGSREYAALDPEGNVWCFGTYVPGKP